MCAAGLGWCNGGGAEAEGWEEGGPVDLVKCGVGGVGRDLHSGGGLGVVIVG